MGRLLKKQSLESQRRQLLSLATCTTLLLLGGCRPGSVWAPDSQRLVVEAYDSLYLFGLEGKKFEKLPTGIGRVLNAGWSPDGKRLAYYRMLPREGRAASLVVAALDLASGKETVLASKLELPEEEKPEPAFPEAADAMVKQLTSLSWSPDGNQIAFVSFVKGHGTLSLVPKSGGAMKRLNVPDADVHSPTWSPDSTQIAFFAEPYTQPGPDGIPTPRGRIEVRVARVAEGTNRRVWLPPPGSDLNPVPNGPRWSADGKSLGIVAEKSVPPGEGMLPSPPGLGALGEIWRVPLEGEAKRLVEVPGVPLFTSVSPDSKQVTFFRATHSPDEPLVVSILSAPFGEPRTLFQIPSPAPKRAPGQGGNDAPAEKRPELKMFPDPVLSPDGKHVVVALEEEGKSAQLWLASTAGGKAEEFTVPRK